MFRLWLEGFGARIIFNKLRTSRVRGLGLSVLGLANVVGSVLNVLRKRKGSSVVLLGSETISKQVFSSLAFLRVWDCTEDASKLSRQ